jgi:hypothetical protein
MKRLSETTRTKVHYREREIVMLPESVGGSWMFLNTRMASRLKVQR